MGRWQLLGIALAAIALASPAAAQTVCPSGCTNTTVRQPDPGVQSPTTMNANQAANETTVNVHDQRLDAITADDTDTSGPLDLEAGTTVGGQTFFNASVSLVTITDPGTDCEQELDIILELDGTTRLCLCIDDVTDNWACAALTD